MAGTFDHAQIRAALAVTDLNISCYLDLQTGQVVRIDEQDTGAEATALRDAVMEGYGDRYRYIPGGNPAADDQAVTAWLELEGL